MRVPCEHFRHAGHSVFSMWPPDDEPCPRSGAPHAGPPIDVAECLGKQDGPVIAATDYVRGVADQIRAFIPHGRRYTVLGTDGYGRSDSRANLLNFFEVNDRWIAHAAIAALADDGVMNAQDVERAIKVFELDPGKPNPITV